MKHGFSSLLMFTLAPWTHQSHWTCSPRMPAYITREECVCFAHVPLAHDTCIVRLPVHLGFTHIVFVPCCLFLLPLALTCWSCCWLLTGSFAAGWWSVSPSSSNKCQILKWWKCDPHILTTSPLHYFPNLPSTLKWSVSRDSFCYFDQLR